jgi:alkylation response protein AidB-like acyl-CoA dehydrogenase
VEQYRVPSTPRLGGDWLVRETLPAEILTPEALGDDHRLVGRTAAEFVTREVDPALDALEHKDWTVARTLVRRACELGLVGADVPEQYGGAGLDKAAAVVISDVLGASASFSMAFGAQTNLTLLPILAFGTDAQRERYLPALLSGAMIGAYCLSESGAGSDAQSVRTRATRDADGSWRLSGEKMWITNGGFADLFLVFAKVDGEHFTAFIVERAFPGVANGHEEHKMGLHGSSTTPIVLTDARVPAENVLGEIGRGHKIAFNVLNGGRLKLAATCMGAAKAAIAEAAAYATARRQFGQPIASFGAIQDKLGAMAIRAFGVESALFRVAGLVDASATAAGSDEPDAGIRALEEFALEASLLKIAGSEMLDFVVDEHVQVLGGNGFVREYPAERRYRDARVNRIFEGTNEINRLLVPGLWLKRAARHRWAIDEIDGPALAATGAHPPDELAAAADAARRLGTATRTIVAAAARAFGDTLATEQQVTMGLADLLLMTFVAESATLRAAHASAIDVPAAQSGGLRAAALAIAAEHAAAAALTARTAIAALPAGPDRDRALAAARPLLETPLADTNALRRQVAALVTAARQYPF